ncbi:glycosyltransferase [Fulvivirga ulvae]|uniref:glycosyltransferase n=1 Tax=Fulvivirga ulvae TaxID=2904245 RepID=UPI001F2099C9|nr:glycosyltransferase [Fulvivirga ulvae]UII31649.1 glycosyltransferase [Fulvivirga ulvae]
MKKIKVLQIIKSLGRGGAEMLLAELLPLHDHNKFEFHYIYFLPWKDQMVAELEHGGGKVVCFAAKNNIQIIRQYNNVIAYIQKHKIDLIHAHLPWAGFISRIVRYKIGLPVLYTEHNKQERYHKITYILNKLSFKYQSAAIAVSKDVAVSIKDNIKTKIPVHIVLNGVNTGKFKRDVNLGAKIREKYHIPENAFVVGTIAVFRFQKRLIEWLQVFKEVADADSTLYGVVVGDGILKDEILRERERLGLTDKVLFPGLQTNTVDWLSTMDVYMMSSIFEGLPIALLEAMSTKCPILTTDAGGIKEVVNEGVSGLMVPVDNWSELGEKLKLLKSNSELRKSMALEGRKRVDQYFSLARMVTKLEDLYTSTLGVKQ